MKKAKKERKIGNQQKASVIRQIQIHSFRILTYVMVHIVDTIFKRIVVALPESFGRRTASPHSGTTPTSSGLRRPPLARRSPVARRLVRLGELLPPLIDRRERVLQAMYTDLVVEAMLRLIHLCSSPGVRGRQLLSLNLIEIFPRIVCHH